MLKVKLVVEDVRGKGVFRYKATVPRIDDVVDVLRRKFG